MLFRVFLSGLLFCFAGRARAACDWAEQAARSGNSDIALVQYTICAEEDNDPESQYILAAKYYKGEDVGKPDFRQAAVYFAKAANNGYAPAQVKLGLLYWRGEGVGKDLNKAYKWLYLAKEPAALRWFYPVKASFDPVAEQVFAKIQKVMVYEDTTARTVRGIPESYGDIARFQHEHMIKAGERANLGAADMNALKHWLDIVKPDVSLPPDEMRNAADLLKPAVLTEKNLDVKKVPVVKKLYEIISAKK